ncbi:RNA polymerase sigma factor [Conexibacter sp. JD483]|uniref:RNA polymerase sigma factor n=1 Tax=unclassified Conexibacter TaxID=2627773 RepID=UPI002715B1F0|nr:MULTISPECIES: RNA polymerase sigma factor [unclassified Conexibacter]MDO8185520.1 RNA polymerase sigma factor [Conexibacter sp. CPCC 205706]MDO8197293.1 RNA polymerase sigma factor [Conexibacter sp. CPCC 205762]MDR9370789.1 RNA polymerase sigma factor [Conexibacter sp. JD483]
MGRDDQSDERLLAATRRDPAAFGPVYERHAPAVLAYLRSRTRSTEQALDLTAEVFAAALQSAHRYRAGEAPVRAWLFGIANHKLIDSQRRARTADAALQRLGISELAFSEDELTSVERRLSAEADGALALRLVGDLPETQRAAVLARVVDERGYDELAERFATSEENVRARVHRGLRRVGLRMAALREERMR